MKNIEKLTKTILKNPNSTTLIHTIPNSNNWIIGQKYGPDEWIFTLSNPKGNVTYTLGKTNNALYPFLWNHLTYKTEKAKSQYDLAKVLKRKIQQFNRDNSPVYKHYLNNDTIRIRVPNTKMWITGKQKENQLWDVFLVNPSSNYKEILKKNTTTKSFALFSGIVLKTPFPEIISGNAPIIIGNILKNLIN